MHTSGDRSNLQFSYKWFRAFLFRSYREQKLQLISFAWNQINKENIIKSWNALMKEEPQQISEEQK